MRDTKSIFFKYFIICAAVILVSFVCLGAVLLLVSSQYFVGEKRDLIMANVSDACIESTEAMEILSQNNRGLSSIELMSNGEVYDIIKSHAQSIGGEFVIADSEGTIILHSADSVPESISQSLLSGLTSSGRYFDTDLDGFYPEEMHSVGASFTYGDEVFYILGSTSLSEQDDYIWNIMQIFLISMVFVLIAALVIVYIVTLRLTAPIKELAQTAKVIGEGNFDERVPEYDTTEFYILGNAFNDMAVSLNNYDKMRSSFVANVSHELRTPMTSIGGFVDGILDGTIPKTEEKKYLRIISSEVQRLTRLVRSMLNLAKIESGSMELSSQSFSLIEPIVDTLVTFESRLEEKNIDVRGLDVDRVMLYADNDLVHQVIYNLLENAIKFVNQDGYIEFGFTPHEKLTAVSIKNSGDGLSQEELPMVFDRFYKSDESRGKDKNGVGLGLNIVRSIVKLHGGNIMVRSVKGEYTEFVFTLPNQPLDKE
ncbi:MAG: HAMP domain-containing histidine kinase [Oscillospiraceae bacterium]|nr:HAMP domain-containing histidine kinase [Oscillospiraceae bacterium]